MGPTRREPEGSLGRPASTRRTRAVLALASLPLLLFAALWWGLNLARNEMVGAARTSVPAHKSLGLDFAAIRQATRHWLAGGNPYREPFQDPLDRPHVYPPPAYYLFAWNGLCGAMTAYVVWAAVLVGLLALGVWECGRTRAALGLNPVPGVLLFALAFWSTPFLYALERGNFDMAVVGLIVAAVAALRRSGEEKVPGTLKPQFQAPFLPQTLRRPGFLYECLAGALLAYAAWIKAYPGVLAFGLVALGRWRAAAAFVAAFAALGLAHGSAVLDWIKVLGTYSARYDHDFHPQAHPLSTYWSHAWTGTRLEFLAGVPGTLAAIAVLGPPVLAVSYLVFRSSRRDALAYPYLLWLVAAGTFVPRVSNDYNLVFLPLAVLAVWDLRDKWPVHALMVLFFLYWQPVWIGLTPKKLFLFKLAGLAAVALCLVRQARAVRPVEERPGPEVAVGT